MAFKMNHVHIKTKDPEKTAKFYVDTMGAKIIGKAGKNGLRIDLHGLHMNISDFLEEQKREQKYGIEHIAIDTDELDALVKKLGGPGHQHPRADRRFRRPARVLLRRAGRRAARVHRDKGRGLEVISRTPETERPAVLSALPAGIT